MPDERPPEDQRPVNRRNLMIVLGGLGVILLLANIGGPRFMFGDDDHRPGASFMFGDDEDGRDIDAKAGRLEAAIEEHVGQKLDAATARIEARTRENEEALKAGVEDLRDGDPDAFLRAMEAY